ncbi:MAG: hypothetical protein ABUL49_00060, partial [bacterium]
MNRLLTAFIVLAAGVLSHAQVDAKEYLAARQKYGIKSVLTASAYRDFTGNGVFELRCTVKGYISSKGDTLMVETVDGLKLNIRTDSTPEFLKRTTTPARLLVKLNRPTINSETEVELVMCTDEAPIAEHDAQLAAVEESKINRARQAASPSRAGARSRPLSMPGQVPSLNGEIGTQGTVVDISQSQQPQQPMSSDLTAV